MEWSGCPLESALGDGVKRCEENEDESIRAGGYPASGICSSVITMKTSSSCVPVQEAFTPAQARMMSLVQGSKQPSSAGALSVSDVLLNQRRRMRRLFSGIRRTMELKFGRSRGEFLAKHHFFNQIWSNKDLRKVLATAGVWTFLGLQHT